MRKPLGRGLDALIPGAPKPMLGEMPSTIGVEPERQAAIDRIRPNPRQPRADFDEAALNELAASIRAQGILQPLLVRPDGDGGYELVAGERRLRAARLAGLREVPIVVREVSDRESLELALIENIQRDDLSPLEEAAAYQRLLDDFGHTQEEIAARVGKSRPAIANALRLLRLPEPIKRELARAAMATRAARRAIRTAPHSSAISPPRSARACASCRAAVVAGSRSSTTRTRNSKALQKGSRAASRTLTTCKADGRRTRFRPTRKQRITQRITQSKGNLPWHSSGRRTRIGTIACRIAMTRVS